MGQTAELLASEFRISRDRQDAWALRSQRLAGAAAAATVFAAELVPVAGVVADEHLRPHLTTADLTALAPVFDNAGTVTAGNSSGLNDGAALLLLADEDTVRKNDWPVLCEWVDSVVVGCNPRQMGLGPVHAIEHLLRQTGLQLEDLDQLEINEAFAAQTLACVERLGLQWTGLSAEDSAGLAAPDVSFRGHRLLLNPHGGAIALGHPLAASGARLLVHLAHRIHGGHVRRAAAALCVGGGMGTAGLLAAAHGFH
jgi:acetyl-CoA acetyltransferase family protein